MILQGFPKKGDQVVLLKSHIAISSIVKKQVA